MDKRTVLFDGYWLASGPPSGRNVVQSLIEGWVEAFPGDDVRVAVPFKPATHFQPAVDLVTVPSRIQNHGAWVMTALPRVMGSADLILTQNFSPRIARRSRAVVATFVHDAIFRQHPEWFTAAERLYLGAAALTLRWSDVVLASSVAEADRVNRCLRFARGKVTAVGLGVPVGLTQSTAQTPARCDENQDFVLAVGRLNIRKNLARLIEAFLNNESLRESSLVVVGAANGVSDVTAQGYTDPRVRFIGSVSDAELRWLYEHCQAFAFPSLDEGFGLPLMEAAYFGARSVASAIPPFIELGTAERLFDPTSVPSIGNALSQVTASPRMRRAAQTGTDPTWLRVATRARAAADRKLELSNA